MASSLLLSQSENLLEKMTWRAKVWPSDQLPFMMTFLKNLSYMLCTQKNMKAIRLIWTPLSVEKEYGCLERILTQLHCKYLGRLHFIEQPWMSQEHMISNFNLVIKVLRKLNNNPRKELKKTKLKCSQTWIQRKQEELLRRKIRAQPKTVLIKYLKCKNLKRNSLRLRELSHQTCRTSSI